MSSSSSRVRSETTTGEGRRHPTKSAQGLASLADCRFDVWLDWWKRQHQSKNTNSAVLARSLDALLAPFVLLWCAVYYACQYYRLYHSNTTTLLFVPLYVGGSARFLESKNDDDNNTDEKRLLVLFQLFDTIEETWRRTVTKTQQQSTSTNDDDNNDHSLPVSWDTSIDDDNTFIHWIRQAQSNRQLVSDFYGRMMTLMTQSSKYTKIQMTFLETQTNDTDETHFVSSQNDNKQNNKRQLSLDAKKLTKMILFYHKLSQLWPTLLQFPPSPPPQQEQDYSFEISLIIPSYQESGPLLERTLTRALDMCHGDPTKIQVILVEATTTTVTKSTAAATQVTTTDAAKNKDENDRDNENKQNTITTDEEGDWVTLPVNQTTNDQSPSSALKQQQNQDTKEDNNTNKISDNTKQQQQQAWGQVLHLYYTDSGGRGPTMNYGAQPQFAKGRILTFLHADVMLPKHWDRSIRQTLLKQQQQQHPRAPLCAFSLNIDLSSWTKKRDSSLKSSSPGSFPYGIQVVSYLATVRSKYLLLPYGDAVLSLTQSNFEWIKGYPPSHCIFEDFELVDWFRRRALYLERAATAAAAAKEPQHQQQPQLNHRVIILPDWVYCSPRRWQVAGVVYVTLVNALLVYRYTQSGWTPQQIFEYYYNKKNNNNKKNKQLGQEKKAKEE